MIFAMHWIDDYQLFLFDFDGILVNTEELHYLAYKKMCSDRGFILNWDMPTYVRHAMYSATGLKEGVYRALPDLHRYEPCWEVLYKEKKQAYAELLMNRGASLMPGVERLLKALQEGQIKRCVVTHSSAEQIKMIRAHNPILDSIPNWITREDYNQPKPSPECYLKAIAKLADEGDRVIGFEDSPRGLKALLGTEAEAFLITDLFSKKEVEALAQVSDKAFTHVSSFNDIG